MATDEWREVVLKTIREQPHKTKEGAGYGAWVVQRIRSERNFSVTIRAGSFYTNAMGVKVLPKEGLSKYDFDALNGVWKKPVPGQAAEAGSVWDMVYNPPAVKPVGEEPEDEIPDAPF